METKSDLPQQRPAAEEVFDVELLDDWFSIAKAGATAEVVSAMTGATPANRPDVNPVTGHGLQCVCPRCPGWYAVREAHVRAAANVSTPPAVSQTPPDRRPNPLVDIVIPVCALMGMLTVCGMWTIPVIAPLLVSLVGLAMTAIVGGVTAIVSLVVVVMAVVRLSGARATRRGAGILKGEIVKRS